MALRLLLLSTIILFVIVDQIQGDLEDDEQSRNDASSDGHPLTTSRPFNTQIHSKTNCECKGKKIKATRRCHCLQPVNGKPKKLKKRCKMKSCKKSMKRKPFRKSGKNPHVYLASPI